VSPGPKEIVTNLGEVWARQRLRRVEGGERRLGGKGFNEKWTSADQLKLNEPLVAQHKNEPMGARIGWREVRMRVRCVFQPLNEPKVPLRAHDGGQWMAQPKHDVYQKEETGPMKKRFGLDGGLS